MPSAPNLIDLETLMREVISRSAVAAYTRSIGLTVHIDNRLPSRVAGDAGALSEYLRRGLARTVDAGRTRKIALALWLDGEGDEARLMLEACRAVGADETPLVGLTELWALPVGGVNAHPVAGRKSDAAESALIPLPCDLNTDAPLMAEKWNGTFRGRYILHGRDLLFDFDRTRRSLAAVGMESDASTEPEKVLELARSRVAAGGAVDFLILDGHRSGAAALEVAKAFRDDPRLAATQIVLTGDPEGLELGDGDAKLFDAMPRASLPWRRLMEVLRGLVQAPGAPGGRAAGDIPALAGRRILIAEDVATNQVLLEAVLAPTGAEIEVVADGAAVLERHAADPADLIVMDLQMPGMGGIAATRRLRAMAGALGAVRVIALTAYARSADRKMALDAGMDAYLAKPIVVAEFYDLLRRMLAEPR